MQIIVKLSFSGKDLAVRASFTGLVLIIFCSTRFKFAANKFKNLFRLVDFNLIFISDLAFKLKIFDCCVVFVLFFSKYKFSVGSIPINVLLHTVPLTFVGVFVRS